MTIRKQKSYQPQKRKNKGPFPPSCRRSYASILGWPFLFHTNTTPETQCTNGVDFGQKYQLNEAPFLHRVGSSTHPFLAGLFCVIPTPHQTQRTNGVDFVHKYQLSEAQMLSLLWTSATRKLKFRFETQYSRGKSSHGEYPVAEAGARGSGDPAHPLSNFLCPSFSFFPFFYPSF